MNMDADVIARQSGHSPVFHFVFFRVVVVGSEHYLKVLGETKKEVGWGMSML